MCFYLTTQELLYIKLLQSSLKATRLWATEVSLTVGKDFFKYSLGPGSATIKQWRFKANHSALCKADKYTKPALLFVCHACGQKHFYQCCGSQTNTTFKGRVWILENALMMQQQIQRFSTVDQHSHAPLHLTLSHRRSVQDVQVPWDSTVSSSETFPEPRQERQVCFSFIMYTLILLKMPGSFCAGLCICSLADFFSSDDFLVGFSKAFCTAGNISPK